MRKFLQSKRAIQKSFQEAVSQYWIVGWAFMNNKKLSIYKKEFGSAY
jgi:hypothetical protein